MIVPGNHIMTMIVVLVVVVAGAVVTIVHPAVLPFASYVRDVAIGCGLVGIGRGLSNTPPHP